MNKALRFLASILVFGALTAGAQDAKPPVRVALVGLVHDHALGFFPRLQAQTDVELVGVVETNQILIERYSKRFNLPPEIFFASLAELFAKTNAQAVATFTSTFDHHRVVEACAAQGVDVMMEKPLATNMKQARAIEAAAKKSGIQVIVNYETSWYPGNHEAYKLVHDKHEIGEIRRMVFHQGHRGPQEIGCSTNFLAWLTDPVLNGGGAINDFGCYGADLATWFLDGEKPVSVTAVALHIKPDIYPKVEDDATIILNYSKAEVVLQPSWNWPLDRKDMEIYGQTGQVLVPVPDKVLIRTQGSPKEVSLKPAELTGPDDNPVAYLAAVVRKEIKPEGLASLGVNVTVVQILEAAQKSAHTGATVKL
jgi:predicted dehydrogenase